MAIIIGGILGYRRFLKERRYFARADLSLGADLLTRDGVDFVRATVGAKSIGKKQLELIPADTAKREVGCYVAVFPYRGETAQDPRVKPVVAVPVFDQQFVESGETVEESVLLLVGQRDIDVLAYRVEFSIRATDPEAGGQTFTWQATSFLAAGLRTEGAGSVAPEVSEGDQPQRASQAAPAGPVPNAE